MRQDIEPLSVRKHFLKLGFEHVSLCCYLDKHLIGDPLKPFSILNLFRQGFLIPIFVLFKPGHDSRKGLLLVMKILSEVGNPVLKLCNSLCVKRPFLDP